MDIIKYIGIPYKTHGRTIKGVDCWGLVVLLYEHEFNIKLPSFVEDYQSVKDKSLKGLIDEQKINWKKITKPKEAALVLLRAEPYHIGVIINEKGDMVHSTFGKDTCIENIYKPQWKNKIQGFFEYA